MARATSGLGLGKALGSFYVAIGADASGFYKEMGRVRSAIRRAIGPEALELSRTLARSLSLVAGAMGLIGAAAIKTSADLERQAKSFERLLGSAEAATKMLKDLQDFAAKTPFTFTELTDYTKRLLALGFEADKVITVLGLVGDTASGLGLDTEGVGRIIKAFGDIRSKGILATQEIKQLAEAGIPAFEILAQKLGKTIPEVMKMVEDRAVTSGMALQAFAEGMNDRFGGMMAIQSQTLLGMWSTVRDEIENILRPLGEFIIKQFGLDKALRALRDALTAFRKQIDSVGIKAALMSLIPPGIMDNIAILSAALLGMLLPALQVMAVNALAAVAPLLLWGAYFAAAAFAVKTFVKVWDEGGTLIKTTIVAIGGAIVASMLPRLYAMSVAFVSGVIPAIVGAATALKGMALAGWAALKPLLPYIAIGGAVAAAAYLIYKNWDWLGYQMIEIGNNIKYYWEVALNGITLIVVKISKFIADTMGKAVLGIVTALQKLPDGIKKVLNITDNTSTFVESLDTQIKNLTETEKKLAGQFNGGLKAQHDAAAALRRQAFEARQASKQTSTLGEDWQTLKEKVKGFLGFGGKDVALPKIEKPDLTGLFSGGGSEDAPGSAEAAKKAAEEAKRILEEIRREWIQTTKTELEQLDIWYQEQQAALKSAAVDNKTLAEYKEKLDQSYLKKKEEVLKKEADKERQHASELAEIQRQLKEFQEIGPEKSGSDKFFDDLKRQADEWLDRWDKNINQWKEKLSAAELEKLNLSQRRADLELQIESWKQQKSLEYVQSGQLIEDEAKKISREKGLVAYMQYLNSERAAFLAHVEGKKEIEDVYRDLQMQANRSQFSYMAEAYRTMYSGLTNTLTDVITGAQSAGDALKQMGKELITMVVRWIVQKKLAATMSASLEKAVAASSVGTAAMVAQAWAPAAAMVSAATFGASTAAAAAGLTSLTAMSRALAIPGMAKGGIVTGPTLAMIGEGKNDEAVIPLNKRVLSQIGGGSGSGDVKVIINNNAGVPMQGRATIQQSPQETIVNLWLDAYSRDVGGLRTAVSNTRR